MKNCPHCKSDKIIKYGIVRQKQRYRCKSCSFNFTTYIPKGTPLVIKKIALQLYLEGLGFRAIGRVLGVSQVSVYNWIKSFGSNLPVVSKPEKVEVMELDEIWHFVGKKNEKGGYGSLFVALPKESSDMLWAVVERQLVENSGNK